MAVLTKDELEGDLDMESIYRQYALPLKKYIYSMCKDSELADDIVSETFYKAIKNINSFYGGNIFTWLCTIAKNLFFNHTKKKENQNVSIEDAIYDEPASKKLVEESVVQRQGSLDLYKSMQALDSIEREVIYLRTFPELSFKEIGEVLNKSENWARVTFFRSKEKLRRNAKDF